MSWLNTLFLQHNKLLHTPLNMNCNHSNCELLNLTTVS